MIVITLVLIPEQMLPALRVLGSGSYGTRSDGEDDRHDDKCRYHGYGDDLGQSDGTGWGKNVNVLLHNNVMYLESRLAMKTSVS